MEILFEELNHPKLTALHIKKKKRRKGRKLDYQFSVDHTLPTETNKNNKHLK